MSNCINERVTAQLDEPNMLDALSMNEIVGVFRIRVDKDYSIIYGNNFFYYLLGYADREDMLRAVRLKARLCIHQDSVKVVDDALSDATKSNKPTVTFTMCVLSKDKTMRWVHCWGSFVYSVDAIDLCGCMVDITQQVLYEKKLSISDERYRIAFENSSMDLWEYDYASNHIVLTERAAKNLGAENKIIVCDSDYMKNGGHIHPNDFNRFLEMFNKLIAGEKSVQGVFRIKNATGNYIYLKIQYVNIFDEYGRPYRAVGMSQDVTGEVVTKRRYETEIRMRHTIDANLMFSVIINLNDENIDDVYYAPGITPHFSDAITANNFFDMLSKHVVDNERAAATLAQMTTASLRSGYAAGEEVYQYEFIFNVRNTDKLWVRLEIRVAANPETCELFAFVYLRDIDAQKRAFTELEHRAQRDSLTGLYNVYTARLMVDSYLHDAKGKTCAMFMLDLDNFKAVNDKLSHYDGDCILVRVAAELRHVLSHNDILIRIGGDEFAVFVKDAIDEDYVSRLAEKLFDTLQFTITKDNMDVNVSCCVGVTTYTIPNNTGVKTFDMLYKEADAALRDAKTHGKHAYRILSDTNRIQICTDDASACDVDASDDSNVTVQLSALLKYMDGGVLLIEVGDVIKELYISPGYYALVGVEAKSNSIVYQRSVYREDLNIVSDTLRAGAENGGQAVECVYRAYFANGKLGYRQLRAVRIPYHESDKPVLICVVTDITRQHEITVSLNDDKEKLSLAVEQADIHLWDYDRNTHTATVYGLEKQYSDVPSSMILSEIIHKDSIDACKDFCEKMESNAERGSVNVRGKFFSDKYEWCRFSFINQRGNFGEWQSTVGITTLLPHAESQLAMMREQERLLQADVRDIVVGVRANITKNNVEFIKIKPIEELYGTSFENYNDFICKLSAYAVNANERESFLKRFTASALSDSFERGANFERYEFRRKTAVGSIEWVHMGTLIQPDPLSGNLIAYTYLRIIDERKRWEIELDALPKRETSTLLYDLETFRRFVEHILNKSEYSDDDMCCLCVVDLRGLTELRDTHSSQTVYDTLSVFGRMVRVNFDRYCVTASDRDEQILMFIPYSPSTRNIEERVGSFADMLRPFRGDNGINELITGAVTCVSMPMKDASYGALIHIYEEVSCHVTAKKDGRFYTICTYEASRNNDEVRKTLSNYHFNIGDKLEPSSECAFAACMRILISNTDIAQLANNMLKVIAEYYKSPRTYILSFSSDKTGVKFCYEYTESNDVRRTLTSAAEILPIDRFAAVKTAMETKCVSYVVEGTGDRQRYCIVVPFIYEDEVKGVICIDSPLQNTNDLRFAGAVCAYWILCYQNKRLAAMPRCEAYTDMLTGVYNSMKLSERTKAYGSAGLSSIGVLCADINGISETNKNFGHEYGDELLVYMSKLLVELFGQDNVYRVAGDEFYALLPNTLYNTFTEKCRQAADMFSKVYASGVSIGYSWADVDIDVSHVITNARELMRGNKHTYYSNFQGNLGYTPTPEMESKLINDIDAGRYVMYLQPKINTSDGSLEGAEALARYIDPERGVITPSHFIPGFEKCDLIKHVDFCIIEQAIKAIRHWIDIGITPIPIAVNFSRKTLLDAETLQRTLDLVKKYDVPTSLIEIEITESVGKVERAVVSHVCETFADSGFRISLDDIGSAYSSLAMLSAFKFDTLKVDKTLINDIVSNETARVLVESLVSFCRKMHITIIAEGVETDAQFEVLRSMNCQFIQGYIIDKPMRPADFEKKYMRK